MIVVGSGAPTRPSGTAKWGHFAEAQWQRGDRRIAEVMISGEGLARPAAEVFSTLLHEATHGLALTRGVADTSRQGRWHNRRFAELAEVLGLTVTCTKQFGWSACTMTPATVNRYAADVARLGSAMAAYRRTVVDEESPRSNSNNGVVWECECPRKIRLSRSAAEVGPILCTVCDELFRPDEGEVRTR
jgi:hypothetical protein